MSIKSLFAAFLTIFTITQSQELLQETKHTPQWLHQGFTLYLDNAFSDTEINEFKKRTNILPTFQELEDIDGNCMSLDDCIASYLLVKFIDTQWNREKLLALFDDYDNFENILRHLKKNIETHWNYCTFFETLGFKSGTFFSEQFIEDLYVPFQRALSTPRKNGKIFKMEEIFNAFQIYKDRIVNSNNRILTLIKNKNEVAGWALFIMESESNVTLEILCINPDYRIYDIGKKIISNIHKKFRTIRSIVTINKEINVKMPYFCGTLFNN
jgi:hypothetical protein